MLCLFFLFALAPTYARPECGKRSSHGTLATQASKESTTLPFSISSSSSFSFFPVCPLPLSQLCILPVIAEQYPGFCAGSEFQYSSDHLPAIRKKTHTKRQYGYIFQVICKLFKSVVIQQLDYELETQFQRISDKTS